MQGYQVLLELLDNLLEVFIIFQVEVEQVMQVLLQVLVLEEQEEVELEDQMQHLVQMELIIQVEVEVVVVLNHHQQILVLADQE